MATALIVDDDPATCGILARMLHKLGYETAEVANGIVGEYAALQSNPDVIVMDLMMPMQNGYETSANLRRQGYSGHIIIISAFHEIDSISTALTHGADKFMAKPVSLDDLCRHLEAHAKLTQS